jgi:hypothetical protein
MLVQSRPCNRPHFSTFYAQVYRGASRCSSQNANFLTKSSGVNARERHNSGELAQHRPMTGTIGVILTIGPASPLPPELKLLVMATLAAVIAVYLLRSFSK